MKFHHKYKNVKDWFYILQPPNHPHKQAPPRTMNFLEKNQAKETNK